MDEMDDYYRNKISRCPKYNEWTRLSDNSEMFYCKKYYRKPIDEIKLLAHMRRTIVTNDRAAQKNKKSKSESLTYDELVEKVRNNDVYKEFMKLEPGKEKFYDSRYYVSGNADDMIQLMKRISNRINCNKKRKSGVDVVIGKRGTVVDSAGVDKEIETKDAVVALLNLKNPRGGDATSPLNNVVIEEGSAEAEEDNIDFEGDRDADVALLSLDNPGEGDATSPLNNVVIKERGGAEAEEADSRRDDIDFEGDRDANVALLSLDNPGEGDATSPLNNVVIKEGGGAEAEEADGRRNDIDFEDDSDNLVRGEEETALTDDCAMSTSGDEGAEESPVNDMDEIGLIFNFDDIETKVCLKECGSYVKFNKCLHRGYKKGNVKTYLSAQLFSAPLGKRSTVQKNVAKFEEGTLNKDSLSVLKSISEAVQRGWNDKYMKKKFNAPKTFQSRKLNQEKTRKINQQYIKDLDLVEVRELIEIFERIYPDIRVTEVWFLKKKEMGDGFEDFHYDYGSSMGGFNAVSSTIVVNLGVFSDASEGTGGEDDEEAGDVSEEDEDDEDGQVEERCDDAMGEQCDGYQVPPSLRKPGLPMEGDGVERRRRDFQAALMRDITPEEEQLIHQSINQELTLPRGITRQDLIKLKEGPINMDIIQVYLTRFLSKQDEKLCEKDPSRSKSVFFPYFLDYYYDRSTDKYIYKNVMNFSKKDNVPSSDIFKTKYIFIPIHQGKHFTCAVIYMKEKRILFYDSYLNTDRTRTLCSHKKKDQERILQALLQYLKDEHLQKHSVELPDLHLWTLHSLCRAPQQENTEDCGIFVCLYCELILNDLDLTFFTQDKIRQGKWRKKMILSILSIKDDISNDDNDENTAEVELLSSSDINRSLQQLKFPVKAKKIVSLSKWKKNLVTTRDCTGNLNTLVECKKDCNGGMNCLNKRIQTGLWKNVETKETQGSGKGLFAMEDIKKGDYIIEYVGRLVFEDPHNVYGMRIRDMNLWIDASKTQSPAKYMNHSCEPNCNLEQWAVDGLPRMVFFAIEAIKSGDELTFDYNWELKAVSEDMFKKNATKCKCRKPKCRTYIERRKMQGMRQRGQGLRECKSL